MRSTLTRAFIVAAALAGGVASAQQPMPRIDLHGDPLPDGAIARLGTTRFRFSGAYLQNGNLFSVGSSVDFWDASTGKLIRRVPFRDDGAWVGYATTTVVSRDGTIAATSFRTEANSENTVRIWDTATGKETSKLKILGGVRNLAILPGNREVASVGYDGMFRVWEIATNREVRSFQSRAAWPSSNTALSPYGGVFVHSEKDGAWRIWDTTTGKEVRRIPGPGTSHAGSLLIAPDEMTLAWYCHGEGIRVEDIATGREIRKVKSGIGLAFSPDGKLLAAIGQWGYDEKTFEARERAGLPLRDGTIFVWNIDTGAVLHEWKTCPSPSSVAFSPDQKNLAATGGDQITRLWDLTTGKEQPGIEGHTNPVETVAFSPDGRTVVSAAADRSVRLWNATTGKPTGKFETTAEYFSYSARSRVLSADGRFFANADDSRVWEVAIRARRSMFDVLRLDGSAIGFSPDGKKLAGSIRTDERVKSAALIVNTETGEVIGKSEPSFGYASEFQFSPDGKTVAMLIQDGGQRQGSSVVLLDMKGKELRRIRSHFLVGYSCIAFSPDGKWIVTGATNGWKHASLCMCDVATGEEVKAFDETRPISCLAFSPDGKTLAAGVGDVIGLWDVKSSDKFRELKDTGGVTCLAFSPNGTRLASGSTDTTVLIWPIEPRKKKE
jgi:WD40 repeat protein